MKIEKTVNELALWLEGEAEGDADRRSLGSLRWKPPEKEKFPSWSRSGTSRRPWHRGRVACWLLRV